MVWLLILVYGTGLLWGDFDLWINYPPVSQMLAATIWVFTTLVLYRVFGEHGTA